MKMSFKSRAADMNKNMRISHREKLRLMDTELKSFYDYCQQAGFTDEEMEKICRPLTKVVRRVILQRWLRTLAIVGIVLLIVVSVVNFDSVSWHASSIGRILMLKALPVFDWTSVHNKPCLVEKTTTPKTNYDSLTPSDCSVCESVTNVKYALKTSYEEILNKHLIRGTPVIVTDAYQNNTRFKNIDIKDLTKVLTSSERLQESVPCVLQTNIRAGKQATDLHEIFSNIAKVKVPNWFVHFQNCDYKAVKSLRVLAPRPYFLSPHVPPAFFNWVLISNKYTAPNYKPLDLDTGLIMVTQLTGGMFIQLTPKEPCHNACPALNFEIVKGEILVLANSLWNFEYTPDEKTENMAIVSETAWNEA